VKNWLAHRRSGGDISTQQSAIVDLAVKSKLLLDSIDVWLLTRAAVPQRAADLRRKASSHLGPEELKNYKETILDTRFLASIFLRPARKRLTTPWRGKSTDNTSSCVRDFNTGNKSCEKFAARSEIIKRARNMLQLMKFPKRNCERTKPRGRRENVLPASQLRPSSSVHRSNFAASRNRHI